MNLRQQLNYALGLHKTVAWLLLAIGVGAVLQLLVYLAATVTHQPLIYTYFVEYLSLPSSLKTLAFRPWTLFTYPFIVPQLGNPLLYLIFSGLLLWTFTKIYQQIVGDMPFRRLAVLSIPLTGLLAVIISTLILPSSGGIVGMNVLVATILMTTICLVPSYPVQMVLFGEVKIVYVGAVILVLMLVSVGSLDSPLGIAIATGAALGGLHIYLLKQRGTDYTEPIWDRLSRIFSRKNTHHAPRMKVRQGGGYAANSERFREAEPPKPYTRPLTYETKKNTEDTVPQDVIDKILDKINVSGYDNLSTKEKELLFRASQQNNDKPR